MTQNVCSVQKDDVIHQNCHNCDDHCAHARAIIYKELSNFSFTLELWYSISQHILDVSKFGCLGFCQAAFVKCLSYLVIVTWLLEYYFLWLPLSQVMGPVHSMDAKIHALTEMSNPWIGRYNTAFASLDWSVKLERLCQTWTPHNEKVTIHLLRTEKAATTLTSAGWKI